MTYETPVTAADIEIHVVSGCSHAAAYQHGVLVDHGDYDEVIERAVEALGVLIEHNSDPYVAKDERGRTAPAPTLGALAAGQES